MPRVFLPQPNRSITGPGGVSVQYDWRAAYDESEDTLLKVTLVNEVASYACWTGKFRRWQMEEESPGLPALRSASLH